MLTLTKLSWMSCFRVQWDLATVLNIRCITLLLALRWASVIMSSSITVVTANRKGRRRLRKEGSSIHLRKQVTFMFSLVGRSPSSPDTPPISPQPDPNPPDASSPLSLVNLPPWIGQSHIYERTNSVLQQSGMAEGDYYREIRVEMQGKSPNPRNKDKGTVCCLEAVWLYQHKKAQTREQ